MGDLLLDKPLRFALFYHSIISDWNNGNAHFLRGVVRSLVQRGHSVTVYEPRWGWSMENLELEIGATAETNFRQVFPEIQVVRYTDSTLLLDDILSIADVVVVHEWNDHDLVARIGRYRAHGGEFSLLFHDTHHRMVTAPDDMAGYDLSSYDGVLAFGAVVRALYLQRGLTNHAWTWHEAADISLFKPAPEESDKIGDVVWIGNWGDDERTAELTEFLFDPVHELGLRASIYGVRYPEAALTMLKSVGIRYGGWLPNYKVPEIAAQYRAMVHVPRRPYVESLPGIPTIRPFEAMACGIPLISAWWNDVEGMFTEGKDYLVARNGAEARRHLTEVLNDADLAHSLAQNALATIRARHTCDHRVDELLNIVYELRNLQVRRTVETCPTNG